MASQRVMVPVLNDEPRDFDRMFRLRAAVDESTADELILDFTGCSFIRHTGVAFLGGLIRHTEKARQKVVTVDWSTVRGHIRRNLQQNGFASTFGDDTKPWKGNSVPYREDREIDADSVMKYLDAQWLGRQWVNVSAALSAAIQGKVWEVYYNALEHSGSVVGTFSCGQRYPDKKQLCLCVTDFGVGIPAKVRSYLSRPRLKGPEALEWALTSGTSTAKDLRKGRGLGLNLLSQFTGLNKGRLSIYSGDGHVQVSGEGASFRSVSPGFAGTIIDIRFACDESYYVLSSEKSPEPLF